MISQHIKINLPPPWENQGFDADQIGPINFLVGPNGSGKSQFAGALLSRLNQLFEGNARLLSTDRLGTMEQTDHLRYFVGDNFSSGYSRSILNDSRRQGMEESGISTFALLEERMDILMQIEATLSHLFARDIKLEWDSGNLVPRASRREGRESYRLDRDECHGIKELLVLLSHLYDNRKKCLIVDEPELNLHPQFQSFFMQEARKVAGDPNGDGDKKIVFLITHSPFILDIRSEDDLKSVISFDLEYTVPKQVASMDLDTSSFPIGRLNAHNKQLFFSDNPVFVEGPHDATIVQALMEARGVSAAGAGSCIIDAGGVEEVNNYLNLCLSLGKQAYFIYDLDSLFKGKLRSCIRDDESIQGFLASAGLGSSFGSAFGLLEGDIKQLIDTLSSSGMSGNLTGLENFLNGLGPQSKWGNQGWPKARVAVMTAIGKYRQEMVSATSQSEIEGIEGRRDQILQSLKERNIYVLPGGTLERYLPHFSGDEYQPRDGAKKSAVEAELLEIQRLQGLSGDSREDELEQRYEDLYTIVRNLPSKTEVDVDRVLRRHLSDYIHELHKVVKDNPDWRQQQIEQGLSNQPMAESGLVSISNFERVEGNGFTAEVNVIAIHGKGARTVQIDQNTTYDNMPELESTS